MNDYKELVEKLREAGKIVELEDGSFDIYLTTVEKCHKAADAIEQLVKECNRLQPVYDEIDKAHHDTFLMYCKMKHERDAAVADLKENRVCTVCVYGNDDTLFPCEDCCAYTDNYFEWRGVQEDNDEID